MSHTIIAGPFGKADELPLNDGPNFAATVCHYLVTAPIFHPAWSQYNFHILRLTPNLPGLPEPHLQFTGATHEIGIVALDPSEGPQTYESMIEFCTPDHRNFGKMPWLSPVNIACQIITRDEGELLKLAPHLMRAIVIKGVSPETSDAPDLVRRYWHQMIEQGLAHMRGEHKGRVTS
jgi:hypothetical protein